MCNWKSTSRREWKGRRINRGGSRQKTSDETTGKFFFRSSAWISGYHFFSPVTILVTTRERERVEGYCTFRKSTEPNFRIVQTLSLIGSHLLDPLLQQLKPTRLNEKFSFGAQSIKIKLYWFAVKPCTVVNNTGTTTKKGWSSKPVPIPHSLTRAINAQGQDQTRAIRPIFSFVIRNLIWIVLFLFSNVHTDEHTNDAVLRCSSLQVVYNFIFYFVFTCHDLVF